MDTDKRRILNPMIHTATTTVNISNSVGYTEDEKVEEKIDKWEM